jgi:hypothetical protein
LISTTLGTVEFANFLASGAAGALPGNGGCHGRDKRLANDRLL